MKNYRLLLSYDGTDYSGWQQQPRGRTVQGTLEAALARLAGKPVSLIGAGRTDAGVHARGQTASFKADLKLGEAVLFKALNATLPADIRVLRLEIAPPGFHARRNALSKTYRYRIVTSPIISPFDLRYALHWPHPLNLARMRRAARLFVRKADFSGFSSNRDRFPVRRVLRSELQKKGGEILYTIEAAGFLRYMVRTIVGTLLEIGRGRFPVERVEEIFRKKIRTIASPTAPAKGLCLMEVRYGKLRL